jgi:O-antigen/teichoic acid export membrane protein
MSLAKKVAQNTSFDVVGRIIQLIVGSATVIILTRYLGPNDYGLYVLVIAFIGLFSDISGLGINMTIARKIPKKPSQESKIFSNALSLKLLTSVIIFGIAVIVGMLLYQGKSISTGIILAALSSFFLSVAGVYKPLFQIKLKVNNFVIADIVGRLVTFGLILYFVYLNLGVNYILATLAIGSLVNLLMTDYYARKLTKINWQINLNGWKEIISEAILIAGFVIISGIIQKIGIVILSKYKEAELVGIYQLALQPIIIVIGLGGLFISIIYPIFSKYIEKSKKRLANIFSQTVIFLFYTGLYIGLFIFLTSKQSISILGGAEYYQAIPVLKILSLALFSQLISLPFTNLAIVKRKEKPIFFVHLIGLIITVTISLITVKEYSLIGIAWAYTISTLVTTVSLIILEKDQLKETVISKEIINRLIIVFVLALILYLIINSYWFLIDNFENYNIATRIVMMLLLSVIFFSPLLVEYRNKYLKL